MSTATLTSLAMLKVKIDQGDDYLGYLVPFVLQILVDHRLGSVSEQVVRELMLKDYGLEIPDRTIQIVLKRISKKHPLRRAKGAYHIAGNLPNPGISTEKEKALLHIKSVVRELIEFSRRTSRFIESEDHAVKAICAFLEKFDIPCLRAYLRRTAIPSAQGTTDADILLVSHYILYLQRTKPKLFDSFMVMVQGHMLANALLCPDLQKAPKQYKDVIFYLDTPLLVHRLGLEGAIKEEAMGSLIQLLNELGAPVAAFSHSIDELKGVIIGASKHIDTHDARGAIVTEARRRGATKSDLRLQAETVEDDLKNLGIRVKDTPRYALDFQIDEVILERAIKDEISYFNPRAREYDVNSVRSIYMLRKGSSPRTIERSKAVLVTSNAAFARVAWDFGQKHEEMSEVSSVITSFSLANMAWLKAPMVAPSLPNDEVLAFSYAALHPSTDLLNKFMTEIDRLEQSGVESTLKHQLLRSSLQAQDELAVLTLGDPSMVTEDTLEIINERVSNEIKREESERTRAEQETHRQTQGKLSHTIQQIESIQKRLYRRCEQKSKRCAMAASVVVTILILAVTVLAVSASPSFGLQSIPFIPAWIPDWAVDTVSALLGFVSLVFGTTVRSVHHDVAKRSLSYFLKKEAAATDLDLSKYQ